MLTTSGGISPDSSGRADAAPAGRISRLGRRALATTP